MDFRRSRPGDLSGILEIEEASFSDPFSQKDVLSYLCCDDGMCFSALDGDEVIAYVIGRKIPPEAEIYRVAVKESHRRRGIGFRLLSYALKTERGSGVESVFLEVRKANLAARRLYLSHGFSEIGERKNYYKNPTDDAVIMLKQSRADAEFV